MENHLFPNHFEPSPPPPPPSSMPTWQSLSSAMEIQQSTLLNCSSDQSHDFFYNPSSDHGLQYDSALSSMVSSPAASDPNNISNDNLVIRELIGKLGTIGNNNNNNNNTSCYSTPLNSPPKLNQMNHHLPGFGGKPMALNSGVAQFATDPGFAERAAKFSCFGSRSFNGRSSQFAANNGELAQRSAEVIMENGKLPRVASSPLLKTLIGSQIVAHENKNSALQGRMEVDNAQDESSISEQNPNVGNGLKPSLDINSRKRKASTKGKAKETSVTTKGVEGKDSNAKRSKPIEGEGNENGTMKVEEETKGDNTSNTGDEKQNKSESKPLEPSKDYIHVRARRGQATDSHSLAERVRREKISERMKLLQDLVPGCNKVTGKALMLDEIINYVQSLQRQVEFLSMKLSSVNSKMDFSIESLISKDIFQSNNSLAHPIFPLDSSASAFFGHQTPQDHVIQYNIPNGTVTHSTVDTLDTAFCQNIGMQLPSLDGFNEGGSQFPLTFCEDDLNTIVQMGFGQTANSKTPGQPLSFNGSSQVPQMKVEL